MTFRKGAHLVLLATLLVLARLAHAQPQAATPASRLALTDPMPVDPAITIGRLSNGLRYYIRPSKKPEKRAELRLVVKAGSILEEDDQQGLAHFVEHMAFNGTQHFPKQDVVSFLESLGMRFGADINAYTSFDETVYMLQVPTDKAGALDRSLLILEDWAHNVAFDPIEIDKERGVVMEEWRGRRGAGARMQDKLFPILLKGSRYADRIPIGRTDILQGFKPDRLKTFYADWYRPELMAVVAVGDFEKADVESMIKAHFGSIPASTTARPRQVYEIPDHPGTIYAITSDKELTSTSVEVDSVLPARPYGAVGVYRQRIVDRLFSSMVSARLAEMTQKAGAPFMSAFAGRGPFLARSKESTSLGALVKEGNVARGLDALLSEARRVTRFGFTPGELDRQKQSMLRGRQRLIDEKDSRESSSRADEYVRNFLTDETLPTSEDEFALHVRFLQEITLDEVNRLATDWFTETNRIVIVNTPDRPGVIVPDETQLAAVFDTVAAKELTPYVDTAGSAVLLESPPSPGAVTSATTNQAAGVTEWRLSNGARVVLKPTTFKQDEIVFRAWSPGGTSLASDADYIPASTATQVLATGGLGKFSPVELRRVLTGKIASASPFIGDLEEGLSGSASPKDLETLFQLIYLRFTQPRADAASFVAQQTAARTMLANQTVIPEYAFIEALTSIVSQNHPRARLPTAASVDEWNLDKSMAFYKDRFADASDFTFLFVGTLDPVAMKPLVERYIATLPSLHRKETWKDVGVRTPSGTIVRKVEKGIEPKSLVALVFTGPFQYDQAHRVAIRAMAEVLQTRLLDTIREELGGTYSITARQSYRKIPNPEYSISINFGCDPSRADALVARVLQEIEAFKANGPTTKQVDDEKQALLREFETNSQQNGYLLNQISLKYQYGEDPASVWVVPEFYKKLDAAAIQQAATLYLSGTNRVQVILMPEAKPNR